MQKTIEVLMESCDDEGGDDNALLYYSTWNICFDDASQLLCVDALFSLYRAYMHATSWIYFKSGHQYEESGQYRSKPFLLCLP